ncbi:putative triacylglyceride transporter [Mycobacterium kiyosense]|uniref:MFS-type drug efflux transporter P55 n=2 Tax=Mycobacteriaceae TaxID=1762 RepID=A0A9P3Q4H1_9MYCO|nr:putative triacylglyceride transporter [Mycobacterium kiyosense]BDE13675.1 putative triacylglyceride transporter [Mycobacterium sp. 20KCMC460]GLB86749.1 putative triacylglyceride transporter [Mycobacterium kiyosense]GLB89081.1 putative triacylglyceride transporter [Mycobacterium kiyosense]GLB94315.1 putative triacylglyceride transporter [Mycobacterium kiyosense]
MTMRAGRRIAISAGSLAVLLGALDTYVVVTIMRDIMGSVGIPVNQLQRITWIVTLYLLGYIAAMPLLGRASDRFGRKFVLQSSLALFIVGSVLTAMSVKLGNWNPEFGDYMVDPDPNRAFHYLIAGRTIQGIASGALLPVTLALGADLWAERNRAGVLGGIGAAQELGSVLGPLYGIFIVWLLHDWRDVFWVNVPLTLIAMVMIHFSLPSHERSAKREKIDITGGLLLALALGLAVIGLYNPKPDGKEVLPSYGPPLVIGAVVAGVLFFVWERFARTRLIEPAGVHFRPFLSALGASVCAGAALMVTLVNVELFGQGVLAMDQNQAAGLLLWFLIALPIGAVIGGWIATRTGDRVVVFVGLLIAGSGYWLISYWRANLLNQRHDIFGLFTLPAVHTDLLVAGLGLGLVIGPLSSAALRVVPAAQHGIASASVVVARMTGMLIGVAALTAWGLYRFNQIVAESPVSQGSYVHAFALMYGDIFKVTVAICVVGALLGLLIGARTEHAGPDDQPVTPGQPSFEPAPATTEQPG